MRRVLALLVLSHALAASADSPSPPKPVPVMPLTEVRSMSEAGVLDWLKTAAKPFSAATPSATELEPLVDSIGNARVVGIGEITHGTHEDLAFKSALIQALIRRGDINALVFELNRRSGERLDQFVARGSAETDAAAAMRDAQVYGVWMTHELADLLAWVRTYNASAARPVRIVGVDVQDASADLEAALAALERFDRTRASALRADLAPWLTAEASKQHQSATVQTLDSPKWQRSRDAARALASALKSRDAEASWVAEAAVAAIEMMEYDIPGKAATYFDTPADVAGRRDAAMAHRLLQAVPAGRRGIFWAHNDHLARGGLPAGMGLDSAGTHLHQALGPADYRVVTFLGRDITFNAKGVANSRVADRTHPYEAWRYVAGLDDLASLFARAGKPMYWADVSRMPPGLPGIVFRLHPYGQPSFGWNASDPFPVIPTAFGYQSDIVVFFETMTPSRRL